MSGVCQVFLPAPACLATVLEGRPIFVASDGPAGDLADESGSVAP